MYESQSFSLHTVLLQWPYLAQYRQPFQHIHTEQNNSYTEYKHDNLDKPLVDLLEGDEKHLKVMILIVFFLLS